MNVPIKDQDFLAKIGSVARGNGDIIEDTVAIDRVTVCMVPRRPYYTVTSVILAIVGDDLLDCCETSLTRQLCSTESVHIFVVIISENV